MTKNNVFKKGIVIGLLILFVGASVVPSISGTNIGENRGVLFEDDFNDNTKDLSKWSEIYNDGFWWEINERTEFYLSSTGNPISEGIESINVPVSISQDLITVVSVDMITNINSIVGDGQVYFKVDAGANWVEAIYDRSNDQLKFKDSNDGDWTVIGNRGDGTWTNVVKIYSDRYRVQISGFTSGWVSDSLFSSSSQLKMILYAELDASSGDFIKLGYDNAKIENENFAPNKPSKPSGPTSGKKGTSCTYTTSATDPDGDQLYYMYDWDDGTPLEWDGPYASGATASISHTWDSAGTYAIKVKAKDLWGEESDWSDPLSVSMPRSRIPNYKFLISLFERFPNAFPILQRLLLRL